MSIKSFLDRELQRTILYALAESYPTEIEDFETVSTEWHENQSIVYANLFYLKEHGLINMEGGTYLEGDFYINTLTASHKGMDFLMDDGGLSAILNVVTVKLHDETIQALLESKINASELPAEQKQSLLNQIRELRGEAAKHLITKIIDYGLSQGPAAMSWLTTAIKTL